MKQTIHALLGALIFAVLAPVTQAAAMTPLNWVFSSDPQYPWSEKSDSGEEESSSQKHQRSRALIDAQYSNIADFRQAHGGAAAVPVMINGDMTAFGHASERSVAFGLIDEKLNGLYDFGLGNHDYANNVDDCFLNLCAGDSVGMLISRYWSSGDMDLTARDVGGVLTYFGSLAYSKTFGDVHMIQLNYEPSYTVDFDAGSRLTFNRKSYRISDSFDWLEANLASARAAGKIIIINMHNTDHWKGGVPDRQRFRELIERFGVTAVFAGHIHNRPGQYYSRQAFGSVPVFLSGSASQQTYLTADFSSDLKTLNVHVVRDNDWRARRIAAVVSVRR